MTSGFFSKEQPRWRVLQENRDIRNGGKRGHRAKTRQLLRKIFNREVTNSERVPEVISRERVPVQAAKQPMFEPPVSVAAAEEKPVQKKSRAETRLVMKKAPEPAKILKSPEELEAAVHILASRMRELMKMKKMTHVTAFVQARKENEAALDGIPMDALKEKLLAIFRPNMKGANHYGLLNR